VNQPQAWETEEGWEQVVTQPVRDHPMAPRDAYAILAVAGEAMRWGVTAERLCEVIALLAHSRGRISW